MKNADIRNVALIWLGSLVLAIVTALAFAAWAPATASPTPTAETATTHWISDPASTLAERVRLNTAWTIGVIFPFLYGPILTLLYVAFRFSKPKNPKASSVEENVSLEVFWTITPAIILVVMAVPAYGVLRYIDNLPELSEEDPHYVVDVTGRQFDWFYSFPKYGVEIVDDGSGDQPLYLPVNRIIMMNGTSSQVNHAWWVPAFGVKFDVIPGRINPAWFRPTKEGFFKGQCAELCGSLHAFMWIHVNVVPEAEFFEWIIEQGGEIPAEEVPFVASLLGDDVEIPVRGGSNVALAVGN